MTHKILTTDKEVSAFTHRTRMRMLEVLREGPATVSAVAQKLDVHPANLTRHMRILVSAELAKLIEKRDTGRNLEKWYQATATSFEVAPDSENLKSKNKIALSYARSALSAALARLPDNDTAPVNVMSFKTVLTQAGVEKLATVFAEIEKDYNKSDDENAAGEPIEITLAFFPAENPAASGSSTTTKEIRLRPSGRS